MKLESHYQNLYLESIEKIKNDEYETDPLIQDPTDTRYGITLVFRPSQEVKENIQHFLQLLQSIDPHQYYYRNEDLHVTVMSIISCYSGFNLEQINVKDYCEIIESCLKKKGEFQIHFKGLTASPSCILISGYLLSQTLNDIRDELRINFKASSLQQSIDSRYAIKTAHSTVVRFQSNFNDKHSFIDLIDKYKDHDFGIFKVDKLELVANDWYQRKEKVKVLRSFLL